MTGTIMRAALALTLAATATVAGAHGLLMRVAGQGREITGELFYSNGQRAGGEWIELFDAQAPDRAVRTVKTDGEGRFALTGEPGHAYQVRATGEEGHAITMSIDLSSAARGSMVRDDGDAADNGGVPAWALVGGALILSAIPAWFLRKRPGADAA
jgi:hypothetical protein